MKLKSEKKILKIIDRGKKIKRLLIIKINMLSFLKYHNYFFIFELKWKDKMLKYIVEYSSCKVFIY